MRLNAAHKPSAAVAGAAMLVANQFVVRCPSAVCFLGTPFAPVKLSKPVQSAVEGLPACLVGFLRFSKSKQLKEAAAKLLAYLGAGSKEQAASLLEILRPKTGRICPSRVHDDGERIHVKPDGKGEAEFVINLFARKSGTANS